MTRNTAVVFLSTLATIEGLAIIALSVYMSVNYSMYWLLLLLLLSAVGINTASQRLEKTK
jgi:hypothetical protein